MTLPQPAAARHLASALASLTFADDKPVFGNGHHLLPGTTSPLFGNNGAWSGDCIGRPANRPPVEWRLSFPNDDPLMNLRMREFAFCLLNPTHEALRRAAVFLPAEPARFGTVMAYTYVLGQVMRWGAENDRPVDLGLWHGDDWVDYTACRAVTTASESGVVNHVIVVRALARLAPVITGLTSFSEPWDGRPARQVALELRQQDETATDQLKTPSIPPQTWWPLIRAAWTYIHTFAPDLLRWRERIALEDDERDRGRLRRRHLTSGEVEQMLDVWLADPANLIPVHATDNRHAKAGTVLWTTLSLAVSNGTNKDLFSVSARKPSKVILARRDKVLAAAEGRTRPVGYGKGRRAVQAAAYEPLRQNARSGSIDDDLRRWLSDPQNLVPVRAHADHGGPAGSPVYAVVSRLIWGSHNIDRLAGDSHARSRRRRLVDEAVAEGRTMVIRGSDWGAMPIACPDAAHISRSDGTRGPWRTQITRDELDTELRMIRAACYLFVAAISLMRDSEVQEIQRGAITTHYGSPAVVSKKTKLEPARPELRWWIIEPVAEAVAVAEQISWHPTHIFATMKPPTGTKTSGRPGIESGAELDFFIAQVNTTHQRTGLDPIPAGAVRSHMFRKTMSLLTAREPDSEIALGLQLKHVARRALSNHSTQAYGKMDANWAKEFDQDLEQAAALKLIDLLDARRRGERVAVGPGAERFHDGLDNVIAKVRDDTQLRAYIADERLMATLLASEFPDLHLGTLNHCMFTAPQAECQNGLPEAQKGQGPVIGACQPAKCRNSAITRAHAPIWLAEEKDLVTTLAEKRLAPPRRESLKQRLTDVRLITRTFKENGGDL
ncbi:hypothetical protein [Streptomyces sp. NPDC058572]|uniref:hypothetical protein n=1 Tax=Streptomyces sp. NPDC058572 TaxID=3346546 RepID=UPI00364DC2F6